MLAREHQRGATRDDRLLAPASRPAAGRTGSSASRCTQRCLASIERAASAVARPVESRAPIAAGGAIRKQLELIRFEHFCSRCSVVCLKGHDYGGHTNYKQPQKTDQCVNHHPGLKWKASARLDNAPRRRSRFSPCHISSPLWSLFLPSPCLASQIQTYALSNAIALRPEPCPMANPVPL